jgi:hypothetical protein
LIAIKRNAGIVDACLTAGAGEFARLARRRANAERALRAHGTRRRRIRDTITVVIETVADVEAWFDGAHAFERAIVALPRTRLTRRLVIGRQRCITRHAYLRIVRRTAARNPREHANATRSRTRIGRAAIEIITLPIDVATCRLDRIRACGRHGVAKVDRAEIRVGAIGIRLTTTRNCPTRARSAWTRANGC